MRASIHLTTHRHPSMVRGVWRRALAVWLRCRQRTGTRTELPAMDARGRADIRIDTETASRESRKFFWQS